MPRNVVVARDATAKRFVVFPSEAGDGAFSSADAALDGGLFGPAAFTPVDNGVFSLAAPRNLRLGAAAVNPTDAAYRTNVLDKFEDFLEKMEALEAAGSLRPGGTSLIRRLLANQIPATFPESLYFQYGYFLRKAPFRQVVDLMPGMRLRVECQFSQLVPDGGESFNPLANGYVAGGQAHYQIVETLDDSGKPVLGFDAFLASGVAPTVTASDGGAGGLIDLGDGRLRKRWWRLCYPAEFSASHATGWNGTRQNVALLGADNLPALKSATNQFFQGEAINTPGAVAAFFRGRTYLVPELVVFLNGVPHYVSLGTTVRQLFSGFSVIPRMGNFGPGLFSYFRFAPVGTLRRTTVNVQNAYPNPYRQVMFSIADQAGPDAYDLPVLAGDSYRFTAAVDSENPLAV